MDNENGQSQSVLAPYLPFKTFLSSIEALEQGIPKKIDRTIWRSQSGLTQGQIMAAFRFFGLVDDAGSPTQTLHRLLDPNTDRKAAIAALLTHKFKSIVEHDLTKLTPRLLDEQMGAFGVTGTTRQKAVTFFLQAAKFADMPLSPYLQSQVRSVGQRKRRIPRKGEALTVSDDAEGTVGTPPGSSKTVHLRAGGTITLTVSADVFALSADDRAFVFGLVDKLQAYESETPRA